MKPSRLNLLLARQRKGAVLVLAAILMTMVLAITALAVDLSYIALSKSQLQNTADAAALAGCFQLSSGPATIRSAATSIAAKNKAGGYVIKVRYDDIELGKWDKESASFEVLSGSDESSANAVRVTCYLSSSRKTPVNLFFAPVFGKDSTDITVHAIATTASSRCGLIIGLPSVTMSGGSHTDSYNSKDGTYNQATSGYNGHVCTNGNITMSGPSNIHGDGHPGPNHGVTNTGSSYVSGSKKPLAKLMSYPSVDPGNAATVNDNVTIPLSDNGKAPLNSSKQFVLSGGDGVTLAPGTYYFSAMTLSGGSSIRITGATTIYVTGSVDLSGGSVSNTSKIPKNLQLFPMGTKCVISGSSEFYGVIYGPTTPVTRTGDSDYYGAIVGSTLTLSGAGGIHADEALDFKYLSSGKAVRLVQ